MRNLLILLLLSGSHFLAFAETEPKVAEHKEVAIVQSSAIDENSGVAFSFRYPNAVWTHNDSGGKAKLYLVSIKTGKTLATIQLLGCLNKDWEDVATYTKDNQSYIAIGDFGDNWKRRKQYQICILPEPEIDLKQPVKLIQAKDWTDLRYTYKDGAKNCESLAVDPSTNQFILIEKVYRKSSETTGIYQLDIPNKNTTSVARRIGDISVKAFSAMDISRDGTALIARSYHEGYLYLRTENESWKTVFAKPLPKKIRFPFQLQGEGVCFYPDGKSLLLSTEKRKQPLYKVPLVKSR